MRHRPPSKVIAALAALLLVFGCLCNAPGAMAQETAADDAQALAGDSESQTVTMSLGECVALTIRNNTSIEIAYLNRVLEKYDLVTDATYRYIPQVSIDGTARKAEDTTNTQSNRDEKLAGSATVSQRIPTGGTVDFIFSKSREHDTQSGSVTENEVIKQGSWKVQLTQPLLQGAGIDYDLSFVRQAEVTERINIVNLKNTLIDEVTQGIEYYRSLLAAMHAMEISKESMKISQKSLDNARLEVQYGRMASMDLIQYESDFADRELSLERARNAYIKARLALAKHLRIDKDTRIEPSEKIDIGEMQFDETKSLALAKQNRPDYLLKHLDLEYKEYDLIRKSRDTLPQLDLTAEYEDVRTSTTNQPKTREDDWTVQLELSTPLFGTDRRQLTSDELSAKAQVRIALIELRKMEEDLVSDVEDSIRDLQIKARSVKLAVKARELAQKKLEVEQIKAKAGRSSTFQLVSFQSDLFNAKYNELETKITYLNALNDYDRFLGTTLDTWKIDFKTQREGAEKSITEVKSDR